MSLFRNNPYKLQKKIPQPFKHEIASWEEEKICEWCDNKIGGTIYYCPVCNKYYCIDCAVKRIGVRICPQCTELTFLQTVKVIS
ncbi:hypothetical protein KAR91_45195 [Candidatus Pacearchaeota archaeon]|nr:hypothetical protein [Candidatus Pacearchaeota archaeon]